MNERINILNLHIYLGRKEGKDISYLIQLREQRYLPSQDLHEKQTQRN